jgi:hypothetical protein
MLVLANVTFPEQRNECFERLLMVAATLAQAHANLTRDIGRWKRFDVSQNEVTVESPAGWAVRVDLVRPELLNGIDQGSLEAGRT